MSMVSRSFAVRIVVALILAVTAIVVLSLAVEHFDAVSNPSGRSVSGTVSSDGFHSPADFGLPESGAGRRQRLPSAARYESLGFGLRPTPGTIMLVQHGSSLAGDIAPVVEILANGELVLRRPTPVAVDPQDSPILSGDGHGAGVVLPVGSLELLSPGARGALIWLIQEWLVERPVSPVKIASNDLQMNQLALRRLLSWVP